MEKEQIIKSIGNTPIIRLNNIEKIYNLNNELYIKDESQNYTGSIKDRPALNILLNYILEGKVNDNTIIIEATSGNMGISLAALCEAFKIKCTIVMPSSMSKQRQEMIKKYNANLILIEGGMIEAKQNVIDLAHENKNYLIFNQFENENNFLAHYNKTAKEIEKQLKDIDYMFICFGSSGTISGISSYYLVKGYKTKFIAIEPANSPLLTKGYANKHKIEGIGANFIPPILKRENIYEFISVDENDAIQKAKELYKEENIYAGISTGANLVGVINYIKKHKLENKKILTFVMDKGDRYSW